MWDGLSEFYLSFDLRRERILQEDGEPVLLISLMTVYVLCHSATRDRRTLIL